MLRDFGLVASGALLSLAGRWAWDEWVWRRTAGLSGKLLLAVMREERNKAAEKHRHDNDAPPAEDPWDLVIYKDTENLS